MRNVASPYAVREVGVGMIVIGGAGVLEYFKVFGDGGSLLQLVLGIVLVPAGFWVLSRIRD